MDIFLLACLIMQALRDQGCIRLDDNRKIQGTQNKDTKSHTMLALDSFLGSLLVLPVELWKGIAG